MINLQSRALSLLIVLLKVPTTADVGTGSGEVKDLTTKEGCFIGAFIVGSSTVCSYFMASF